MITVPVGKFCTKDCIVEYGMKSTSKVIDKAKKIERKAHIEKKKSQIKTRKAAAKKACHDYIRARDSGKPCICCGEPLGLDYHAGHFLESGNNPQIRYDERNIHGQRISCNVFKGGDSGSYKENLMRKIGIKNINELLNMKGGTMKRTADDYRLIEDYYKNKLNLIEG